MPDEERQLLARARDGDVDAFAAFVRHFERRVRTVLFRILDDVRDVEEATQDTFVQAWRRLDRFRGDAAPFTWLYRIAINIAIDSRRRQKRSALDFRETMDGVLEEQDEVAKDPFADAHDKELRERLIASINDLTPEHKAVIVLRTIEGLSYKDIGEILGCSEGTVMSRLHYARKKLQDKLKAFL